MTVDRTAERILAILGASEGLVHPLRFLAGALYALRQAEALWTLPDGMAQRRSNEKYVSETRRLLRTIVDQDAEGIPRSWHAGFYYHAAVMRFDACYERVLVAALAALNLSRKTRPCDGTKTDQWATRIETDRGIELPRTLLERNRQIVNALKHEWNGLRKGAAYELTEGALGDARGCASELLSIIEHPALGLAAAHHKLLNGCTRGTAKCG